MDYGMLRLGPSLIYHRDKLKQSQDAPDKSKETKKQNELLAFVTHDVTHDAGPADHQQKSEWKYLKIYKKLQHHLVTAPGNLLQRIY